MAGSKTYLAIGLALALAVPTTVFAQEATIEEKEQFVVKNEKILDKNANEVGMIQFTADVDPKTSFAQNFVLKATVLKKDGEGLVPYEGLSYTWVDPNAEEGDDNTSDEVVNNLPTYTIKQNGTYTVQVDFTNVTTTWDLWDSNEQKILNFPVDINCVDITAPTILKVTQNPTEWTNDNVEITVECADYQPEINNANDAAGEKTAGSGLHTMPYSFDGGVTWSNTNRTTVQENKTLKIIVRDALGNQTSQEVEVKNIDKTAPTASLSATNEKNSDGQYVLTATASDTESGLAELAYSWDNGETWHAGPKATIGEEGTFTVTIRDKAGNTTTASATIAEKSTGTEGGSNTDSNTGSGTASGGSGTGSGTASDGSGTGGGTVSGGSGTGGGTVSGGSGTGSGTVSGGSSTGNSDWEDNNHVSGVVSINKETKETETETDETAETETLETKETRDTKETKETETKAGVAAPGKDEDNGFKFPIGLSLIVAAILIVLSIIILVIKMIIDRHAEAAAEADEEEDMSKVYARVNKEETKVIDAAAAAAAAATKEMDDNGKGDVKSEVNDVHFEDMEIEEVIGAAVTAAIATDEPVVKKIHRKHETTPETVSDAAEVNSEDEISIGEFAAAAVAAGVAVVDNEKEMEAAISEMEEEKAAIQAGAANPAEAVVIEGAHSRLIIDPETGEYTYEFK